jgi:enoyl-CoA hydratase/carnithine racemase
VEPSDTALVTVETSSHGRLATVTLHRPDRRNALIVPMLQQLTDALGGLAVRADLRAVVLRSQGPDFCAGADIAELEAARDAPHGMDRFDGPFADTLRAIATNPVPVVARVQGRALGGGTQLVLACDLAVAARDAQLGIPSARLGVVIPFDSIQRLVAAVGPRRAADLLCAARVLTGAEAEEWGIVTRAVPEVELDEAVDEVVERIVAGAPLSVRASKRGITLAADPNALDRGGEARPITDFDLMAAATTSSEDLAEGLAAFRERRAPSFEGR